jgi:hypothetical protein
MTRDRSNNAQVQLHNPTEEGHQPGKPVSFCTWHLVIFKEMSLPISRRSFVYIGDRSIHWKVSRPGRFFRFGRPPRASRHNIILAEQQGRRKSRKARLNENWIAKINGFHSVWLLPRRKGTATCTREGHGLKTHRGSV